MWLAIVLAIMPTVVLAIMPTDVLAVVADGRPTIAVLTPGRVPAS